MVVLLEPYMSVFCRVHSSRHFRRGCNGGGFPICIQGTDGNISILKGEVTFQIPHRINILHPICEQPNLTFYILASQLAGLALIFSILHLNHASAPSHLTFYILARAGRILHLQCGSNLAWNFAHFGGNRKANF